jgi:hypothetical protein
MESKITSLKESKAPSQQPNNQTEPALEHLRMPTPQQERSTQFKSKQASQEIGLLRPPTKEELERLAPLERPRPLLIRQQQEGPEIQEEPEFAPEETKPAPPEPPLPLAPGQLRPPTKEQEQRSVLASWGEAQLRESEIKNLTGALASNELESEGASAAANLKQVVGSAPASKTLPVAPEPALSVGAATPTAAKLSAHAALAAAAAAASETISRDEISFKDLLKVKELKDTLPEETVQPPESPAGAPEAKNEAAAAADAIIAAAEARARNSPAKLETGLLRPPTPAELEAAQRAAGQTGGAR